MKKQMVMFGQAAGPVIAAAMYLACVGPLGLDHAAAFTAGVTVWCALWWITEAVPIPVTSILPFAVFPLAGVLDHSQLAKAFGNHFILLFMGGFMLSRAAEKSNAHLRVAHGIMHLVGTSSTQRLVIGFMLASAFASMWISNTATALILLPVALAVIHEQQNPKLAVPLLLATAYGASIGGIATLIGTPPNGVFASQYYDLTGHDVSFPQWFKIALPISVLMLIACGFVLTRGLTKATTQKLPDLGPWTPAQVRVTAVLTLTALLWITRTAPEGGWAGGLKQLAEHDAKDATVALAMVILLFVIPSGTKDDKGRREFLLDWPTARDIPWGILLLFAGGLAIAEAFKSTGLSEHVGASLEGLGQLHPILLLLAVCLMVTFLTEVTSNTATTNLLLPILAATASNLGYEPAMLMIPATLSASCAFMLPVATPPNAIVFGSEQITIRQMARKGLALNLIGAVIITAVCYLLVDPQQGLLPPGPGPGP